MGLVLLDLWIILQVYIVKQPTFLSTHMGGLWTLNDLFPLKILLIKQVVIHNIMYKYV